MSSISTRNQPEEPVKALRFVRRGEVVTLENVPPSRTLLDLLREDLQCTGTKEGCGEGDCGACTVVLGEGDNGALRFRAVNSCIRLAHSIDGMALWTVEDIASDATAQQPLHNLQEGAAGLALPDRRRSGPLRGQEAHAVSDLGGHLHPAQEAMVNCHASQCGFCTPGFVMSLFAMHHNHVCKGQSISRELAQVELAGNLCRCTGYRPILDAAQSMAALPFSADQTRSNNAKVLQQLEQLDTIFIGPQADLTKKTGYNAPRTLAGLLTARAARPDAQLVAGCTDVGLWVTKQHKQFAAVLDITRVSELRRIENYPQHIAIGAAVTLADAFAALVRQRPQLGVFATRFAGLPVRNSGTLGGNVANGSPIGDSLPLLLALGASVVLMSVRGHREMPLEQLYTAYRKNVMAPDEVLAWIKVPHAAKLENAQVYKISKRFDDDISAVCLAINLHIENDVVTRASLGVGGVAGTPVRAVHTEAALLGKAWSQGTVQTAIEVLRGEFSPISDMRASSSYRAKVLGNLLQRYWLESRGMQQINLQSFGVEAAP